jgi:hypothetical protein
MMMTNVIEPDENAIEFAFQILRFGLMFFSLQTTFFRAGIGVVPSKGKTKRTRTSA